VYIDPFFAGVLATIGFEFCAIIVYGIYFGGKK